MKLTDELKRELIEIAQKKYPNEMCGIITEIDGKDCFVQCENISDAPTELFEIDGNVWLDYDIKAIVHSHTNGRNYLSKYDMRNQKIHDIDWILVCGEQVISYRPIAPLLGRPFEFNKQDCYNLFRDCYMLAGSDHLPEFEYPENWYVIGMNLYADRLPEYGFEKVNEPELGDVILFQIGSELPNHAGIYIGRQLFIHHLTDRLSKRDIYGGYWQKYTHSIWRYKCKSQLNFMAILENLAMTSS